MLTLNCQIESDNDVEFWQAQQRLDKTVPGGGGGGGVSSTGSLAMTRWLPFTLTLRTLKDGSLEVDQESTKPVPHTSKTRSSLSEPARKRSDVSPLTVATIAASSSSDNSSSEAGNVKEAESCDGAAAAPVPAVEEGKGGGLESGGTSGRQSEEVLGSGERSRTGSEGSSGTEREDVVDTGVLEEEESEPERVPDEKQTHEEETQTTDEEGLEVTEPVEKKKEESEIEEKVEEEKELDLEAEYELAMVVCHVRESWMESQGNLVAHIKVGPSYHLRKEVSWET